MTPAATCKGSSIDVDPSGGLLYAGMNDGTLQIADPRASSIGGARRSTAARAMSLHEKKIAHVHLNPAKPHLLATSSNDLTVAVWDVRMLSGKGGPKKKDPRKLASGKSVTSAYWFARHGQQAADHVQRRSAADLESRGSRRFRKAEAAVPNQAQQQHWPVADCVQSCLATGLRGAFRVRFDGAT